MDFFTFTPQESKAIIFLVVILLIGSGVTLYKKYHPDFAPELLLKENRERQIGTKASEPSKVSITPAEISSKILDRKINLNTATLQELESLPGIGPELGKRIITYRESNGGFSNLDELKKVRGIGPRTFEKLKDLVSVE